MRSITDSCRSVSMGYRLLRSPATWKQLIDVCGWTTFQSPLRKIRGNKQAMAEDPFIPKMQDLGDGSAANLFAAQALAKAGDFARARCSASGTQLSPSWSSGPLAYGLDLCRDGPVRTGTCGVPGCPRHDPEVGPSPSDRVSHSRGTRANCRGAVPPVRRASRSNLKMPWGCCDRVNCSGNCRRTTRRSSPCKLL